MVGLTVAGTGISGLFHENLRHFDLWLLPANFYYIYR